MAKFSGPSLPPTFVGSTWSMSMDCEWSWRSISFSQMKQLPCWLAWSVLINECLSSGVSLFRYSEDIAPPQFSGRHRAQ